MGCEAGTFRGARLKESSIESGCRGSQDLGGPRRERESCPLGLVSWPHRLMAQACGRHCRMGALAGRSWRVLAGRARGAGAQRSHGGCLQGSYLH